MPCKRKTQLHLSHTPQASPLNKNFCTLLFFTSQHWSAQTYLHAFYHTRLSFSLWVSLGVEISGASGLVHLLSHMGRVRELDKGHVGFWTQKHCIKRSLGKSALEQKSYHAIQQREREREMERGI